MNPKQEQIKSKKAKKLENGFFLFSSFLLFILTLSTCANNNKYRIVLHVKKISEY